MPTSKRRPPSAWLLAPALALATTAAWTGPLEGSARAIDVEVDATTIGQGYQIASGDGTLISRRRLDQYLGLHVYNVGPKDAFGIPTQKNQFYFDSSLRISADLGDYPCTSGAIGTYPCATGSSVGARNVGAELSSDRLEVLYAYLGGRDLFGFLDLKLGRQFQYDNYEFTSFDGLSLDAKTAWYLAASVWGGLLVNGFMPVDSPIFRPDGTAPGGSHPHDSDAKPVLGASLRLFGLRDLDARLTYQRIFSPGQHVGVDEMAAQATDGTTSERIGFSARGRLLDGLIVPWFGFRYDLLSSVLDTVQAGARLTLSRRHALQLEYVYSYPTFDGDSIWNLFARSQFDDLRLSYDLHVGALRVYARAFARLFHDVAEMPYSPGREVDPLLGTAKGSIKIIPDAEIVGGQIVLHKVDLGGDVGGRYDWKRGYLRADVYLEAGYGGRKIGADLSSRVRVYREIFALEGRLSLVDFHDDLRPVEASPSACGECSFGVQAGGRLSLARGIQIHLLLEDNVNRYYTSQLRFYALLDLAVLLGNHGGPATTAPRGPGPGLGQFGNAYGMGTGY